MHKAKRQVKKRVKGATASRTPRQEYKLAVQPLASTVVRQQLSHRFSAAPPTDDFPEGGMRICGSNRVPFVVAHTSGNAGSVGGWADASGNYSCLLPVGMDFTTDSTTWYYGGSPFGFGLLSVAYQFERYKIRQLRMRYVPECPSTTAGRVAFNFDRDPWNALKQTSGGNANFAMPDYVDDARISISTPLWQQCSLDLIPMTKHDRADTLHYVGAGDESTTGAYDASNERLAYQGAIGCALPVQTAAATATYGRVYLDYVIDLYEFNSGATSQPSLIRARLKAVSGRSRVQDAKTEVKADSKPAETPRGQDLGRTSDEEFGAILVKSQSQPALRTEGRQVGLQDERRGWFGKPA